MSKDYYLDIAKCFKCDDTIHGRACVCNCAFRPRSEAEGKSQEAVTPIVKPVNELTLEEACKLNAAQQYERLRADIANTLGGKV